MIARNLAVLTALAMVLRIAAVPAAGAGPEPRLPEAGEAQLPDGPPPIGPVRRGADGKIQLITPEGERKAGRPLCDPGAKCVGQGEAFATLAAALAAARPGETIDVVGDTYREAAVIAVPRLTLRGTAGRPHFDCAGLALAADKACLAIAADGVTLDNLEISCAAASPSAGGDAACLRSDGNLRLTLSDIFCHASQSGLVATGGVFAIVHSEFFENGGGSGGRNIDLGRDCISVTVTGSVFRDSANGDEFTSRCLRTEISDSTFRSMRGARVLDFPVGGEVFVYRSTIEKTASSRAKEIIGFADQPCEHRGSLRLKQVQITNARTDALITNFDKCVGEPITVEQVGVRGLPVSVLGFIVDMGGNNLRGLAPAAVAGQQGVPGQAPLPGQAPDRSATPRDFGASPYAPPRD
jgi:hypothetical protein